MIASPLNRTLFGLLLAASQACAPAWAKVPGDIQRFADAARKRNAPYCGVRFAQADHELRAPGSDRLQQLWRWRHKLTVQAARKVAARPITSA